MSHSRLLPPIRNARRKHVSDSAISNELGTVVTPLTSATDEAPVVTHADQMANSGPEDASNRAATATVRPPSLAAKVPAVSETNKTACCDHYAIMMVPQSMLQRHQRARDARASHLRIILTIMQQQ